MKALWIFFIAIILSSALFASPTSDSTGIKKVLHEIAVSNVYEATTAVGYAVVKSPQNERFKKLMALTSPYDLLKICESDTNAVVRLYAFKGLCSRMDSIPGDIARKFKNDSTIVLCQTGDVVKKVKVSDLANGFLQ